MDRAAQPGRLGLRDRDPAAGHPRLRDHPRPGPSRPADRHRSRHGERDPDQRRPAVRRPRPPGVLRPRGDQRARRGPLRQGRRRGDGHRRRSARRPVASAARSGSTRTTPTARAPRTAPTRTTCCERSTPFDRVVTQFTGVPGLPSGDHRRRSGRGRPVQPAARLPDQPAGRLLRGRGRAGDHAQPADHQHPRRTARRRQPAPPAARDHRRREPVGDLDLPEGGHGVLGAAGHRGR